MSKLLHKPFKAFSVYALLILVCSIPVYYIVVNAIWLEELDEHNAIVKQRIANNLSLFEQSGNDLETRLEWWNTLESGTVLTPTNLTTVKPDSTYTITRKNEYVTDELDRFRGLSSYIKINQRIYHVAIETNVEEADETIAAIALVTTLFFLLLVGGFILLNKKIAAKVWMPFNQTLNKLKQFDLTTHKTILFDKSTIEEFEELHQSLHKLIKQNVSVYHQQKTFIENASHELQTPLAVLKSKIELLMQDGELTEHQAQILYAAELPLSRITRVNKNLLLLAKIENTQFADNEQVALTQELNQSVDLLVDYIHNKKLRLQVTNNEACVITANKLLVEMLFNNLLTNAIKYTANNGQIWVELNATSLHIKNTGLNALNQQSLFQRFAVSSTETTSSGLGLAIVKEICKRYKWKLEYRFENGEHIFSVLF